jgi:hypothetical protein
VVNTKIGQGKAYNEMSRTANQQPGLSHMKEKQQSSKLDPSLAKNTHYYAIEIKLFIS